MTSSVGLMVRKELSVISCGTTFQQNIFLLIGLVLMLDGLFGRLIKEMFWKVCPAEDESESSLKTRVETRPYEEENVGPSCSLSFYGPTRVFFLINGQKVSLLFRRT